ncbi:hypothetical protein GCM10010218_43850 [Streptomyces mashuensis]|uniref:Bacterial CdiA-CT RNAse A domain-containing protein n=1 Tax=Streptomyces mashuensis TaxID=33904 RepID=A0A919EEV4_9ACTN|nr:RNase A-like domain-containing protein [Streptomyces mashuensis]GHF57669.1 hypothetical protein GCM10010218_43850 [Streptomyces mashuensis]
MSGGTSTALPDKKQRDKELAAVKTALPPKSGGNFDVKPSHLYYVSYLIRDDQFAHNDGAKNLVDRLGGKEQLAGRGSGPDAFAAAYAKVAKRFLEVWAKSVVSVGGVAVGLTVTANNYASADWHSNKKASGSPPSKATPVVIQSPPHYGTVPDLKWRGTNADSDNSFVRAIGHIPDFLADCLEEVIDKAFRLGKMYKVTPGAHAFEDELKEVADHWRDAGNAALKAGDNFIARISSITDDHNSDWQKAMKSFCQNIWGTTAWGRSRHGLPWKTSPNVAPATRRPVLQVLHDTAKAMEKACRDLVTAASTLTSVSEAAAAKAAGQMVDDVVRDLKKPTWDKLLVVDPPVYAARVAEKAFLSFRKHMDYEGVNKAVDTYNETVHGIARTLEGLMDALDEADRSAPEFKAEEARAIGFGARSLNEFKNEHKWQRGDGQPPSKYALDLATEEELGGGHSLDKHVGKSDAQLLQRLRDQANQNTGVPQIPAASSFPDMESAQKYTQYCLTSKSSEIDQWLSNRPPTPPSKIFSVPSVPGATTTGRTSEVVNGRATPVKDAQGVATRLTYDPNLDPPFVVTTSMPK